MIYENIKKTIIEVMKRKDKELLETLRSMDAEIQNKAIALKVKEITDELVIGVLQKGIKQRLESCDVFIAGGRDDLATKEKIQASRWQFFLPEMMSEEEIRKIVEITIVAFKKSNEQFNLGTIIKKIQLETKGRASGSMISKIAKDFL